MPARFFAGTRDALIRSQASARRPARVVAHGEGHLLEGEGHALLGQAGPTLSFLQRS